MLTPTEKLIVKHLGQFVSDHKKEGIERVVGLRTRYLTVVLEDIFQSQNASAVIRTCECMGIQNVHIVENISKYSVNPRVLKGSHKWIDILHHRSPSQQNTIACIGKLKADGYRVLVTDPQADGVSIEDVDVMRGKIALLFGNELRGASTEAIAQADERIKIPMFGFTESFNISVSAAICLYALVTKIHASSISHGLSTDEKDYLRLQWYRKIVRKSALVESEFLRTID